MFIDGDEWYGILDELRSLNIYVSEGLVDRLLIERTVDFYLTSKEL